MEVAGEVHRMVGPRLALAPNTWRAVREVAMCPASSDRVTTRVSVPAEAERSAWRVNFPSRFQPVSVEENCKVGVWKNPESPGLAVRTWMEGAWMFRPLVQAKDPLTGTPLPPAVIV